MEILFNFAAKYATGRIYNAGLPYVMIGPCCPTVLSI